MFQPKKTFAINLSDFSLEALELEREGKDLVIKSQSRLLLEPGIIEDGKIIQAAKLRDAVQKLLESAQPQPITSREVAITLPESRVFAQTYELPKEIGARQVPSALFSRARETLPIDTNLIAADYRQVGRSEAMIAYLFAATYSTLIDEYVAFFKNIQLKVTLITLESLALGAAIVDETSDQVVLVLDIGSRTTIASIFQHGELRESININIAGNNITAALAEKLKISTAEAEQRKIDTGMKSEPGDGAEMLIIQGQLQPLKDELQVFIKYYEQRSKRSIDRALLAGGTGALFGIDEYFKANFGFETVVAEPLPVFKVSTDKLSMAKFLPVLGLARVAFGDRTEGINFLERKEKDWTPDKRSIRAAAPRIAGEHEAQASPVSRPRSRKRTLALAVLLFIAGIAVLSLYSWKKSGTLFFWNMLFGANPISQEAAERSGSILNFIVRPFSPSGTAEKTLSFVIPVSFASSTPTGYFGGSTESIQIVKAMPYDQSTVDLVRRTLQEKNSGSLSPEALDAGITEYLANRLWDQEYAFYNDQKVQQGALLLASYIDKTIDTPSIKKTYDAGTKVTQETMNVKYRVLTLTDKAAYDALENSNVNGFVQQNPGLVLVKRTYSIPPETPTSMNVVATISFNHS